MARVGVWGWIKEKVPPTGARVGPGPGLALGCLIFHAVRHGRAAHPCIIKMGEPSGSYPFLPPGFAYSAEPSEGHNPRIQGPMSKTLADGVPNFTHPPYQTTVEEGR